MSENKGNWRYWEKIANGFSFLHKTTPSAPPQTPEKAPWKLPEEYKDLEPSLRKQILLLSEEKWNFLTQVKENELKEWKWEMDVEAAQYCIDNDPNLEHLRFLLVPFKISEENFWRNYFARVFLIRQKFLEISPRLPTPLTNHENINNENENIIYNNNNNNNNNENEINEKNIINDIINDNTNNNQSGKMTSLSPSEISLNSLKEKFEMEIQNELDAIDDEIDLELADFVFDNSTLDFEFNENEIKDLLAF